MKGLPASFFGRATLAVAPDLIGKWLVHETPEAGRLIGEIVETEAYTEEDPAFHGWRARFTPDGQVLPDGRTAALFMRPGLAYVYRAYTAWLLNVITEPEGRAGAVLIRAVEPVSGRDVMAERRLAARRDRDLTNGPGKLTEAFGIHGRFHLTDLTKPPLYFAEPDQSNAYDVQTSARIGLRSGVELPYRFFVPGHPYVSPGKPSDQMAKTKRR